MGPQTKLVGSFGHAVWISPTHRADMIGIQPLAAVGPIRQSSGRGIRRALRQDLSTSSGRVAQGLLMAAELGRWADRATRTVEVKDEESLRLV